MYMRDSAFPPESDARLKEMARTFSDRTQRAEKERSRQIALRRSAAFEQIQRLVTRFREVDPEIRVIILFGSLATGFLRNHHFDIDIAVDSDHYWDLLGIALDQPIPVDLTDLPQISEHIRSRIQAEGTVLYER
jgi:predicted nucleotidyltransferase